MTSTPPVTAFAETAALYAVLNNETSEAIRIIGDMLPGERTTFYDRLGRLITLLGDRCDGCGELAPIGTSVMSNPLDPDSRKFLCGTCAARTRTIRPVHLS
jgi:hypothetical protein